MPQRGKFLMIAFTMIGFVISPPSPPKNDEKKQRKNSAEYIRSTFTNLGRSFVNLPSLTHFQSFQVGQNSILKNGLIQTPITTNNQYSNLLKKLSGESSDSEGEKDYKVLNFQTYFKNSKNEVPKQKSPIGEITHDFDPSVQFKSKEQKKEIPIFEKSRFLDDNLFI